MNKNKLSLVAILMCFASSNLLAATLTLQTRSIDDPDSIRRDVVRSGYKATWRNQESSISTRKLSEFDNLRIGSPGKKQPVFAYFKARFSVSDEFASNDWGFRAGLDAGHGGALYLDGSLLDKNTSDLWWRYNWKNTSEIISRTDLDLVAGNHLLEIFWAESCCHGSSDAEFTVDGNRWNTLSTSNLASVGAVPIPMAVWLFGSGVVTLVAMKRRKTVSATDSQVLC